MMDTITVALAQTLLMFWFVMVDAVTGTATGSATVVVEATLTDMITSTDKH